MPKPWKTRQKPSEVVPSVEDSAASKIFGAELSGNAPSVDLHGLDTQSGVHELDLFLHSSFMHGDEVVKIIHGRGSGKMREVVHTFLATQELVEMFRDAQNQVEVLGATYVVLKKST